MKIDEAEIARLFSCEAPYPMPITGGAPEMFDFRCDFANAAWSSVPDAILDRHTDAFTLMDDEPLRFYLPAFLRRSVRDPESPAAVYYLLFFCGARSAIVLSSLSQAQQKLCSGVARMIYEHAPDNFVVGVDGLKSSLERFG